MEDGVITSQDELNLSELIARLLRGWYFIAVCLLLALGFALAWLHEAPRSFTAQMLVAAPDKVASTPADLNMLRLYIQGVHSRGLAAKLAGQPEAVRTLYTAAGPRDIPAHPSGAQMQALLTQRVRIEFDPKQNDAATVSMTARDPLAAVAFLTLLHRATNDYIGETMGIAPTVRLFDAPYAGAQPVSPRRMIVIRNALILGLLVGGTLAISRKSLARLFRRARATAPGA